MPYFILLLLWPEVFGGASHKNDASLHRVLECEKWAKTRWCYLRTQSENRRKHIPFLATDLRISHCSPLPAAEAACIFHRSPGWPWTTSRFYCPSVVCLVDFPSLLEMMIQKNSVILVVGSKRIEWKWIYFSPLRRSFAINWTRLSSQLARRARLTAWNIF